MWDVQLQNEDKRGEDKCQKIEITGCRIIMGAIVLLFISIVKLQITC